MKREGLRRGIGARRRSSTGKDRIVAVQSTPIRFHDSDLGEGKCGDE